MPEPYLSGITKQSFVRFSRRIRGERWKIFQKNMNRVFKENPWKNFWRNLHGRFLGASFEKFIKESTEGFLK